MGARARVLVLLCLSTASCGLVIGIKDYKAASDGSTSDSSASTSTSSSHATSTTGTGGAGGMGGSASSSGGGGASSSSTGGPKQLGASCMSSAECDSGYCVDGVCCENACSGTCVACSASGKCEPVVSGDPHNSCPPVCQAGAADSRTCSNGNCVVAISMKCAPYACASGVCKMTCASDADCSAMAYCDPMAGCFPRKKLASPCLTDDECLSGNCGTGVCCGSACPDTCVACVKTLTGVMDGTCAPVLQGDDPFAYCPKPMTCNGMGSCQ